MHLDTLDLETARLGRVEYRFSAPDRARAHGLAALVDDAATLLEREFGLRFDLSLAALGPDDWFSEFPGVPYAVPWADMHERLLVLPSSLTEGVLIMGPTEIANRRRVDFVALHEYGHVAAREYFRPDAVESYAPVQWFEELVATYVAYAYVAQADPEWAEAARQEWAAQLRGFTPPVLSLDWRFMNDLPGPELSRVYGWYQFLLNEQAAALYDRHGLDLLPRLKEALPWRYASTWTHRTLLPDLRTVTPELARWAESFGQDGWGSANPQRLDARHEAALADSILAVTRDYNAAWESLSADRISAFHAEDFQSFEFTSEVTDAAGGPYDYGSGALTYVFERRPKGWKIVLIHESAGVRDGA